MTIPVHVGAEQGLLGLTVDPHFDQNHFIYIFYTTSDNKTTLPLPQAGKIQRIGEYGNR